MPGALQIGYAGCNSHTHLIVAGPQRGMIWEGYDYEHFGPLGVSFLGWMRHWVEVALVGIMRERVAGAVKIGMTQAQVVAICGENFETNAAYGNEDEKMLRFEGLVTSFILDKHKKVVRISRGVLGSV